MIHSFIVHFSCHCVLYMLIVYANHAVIGHIKGGGHWSKGLYAALEDKSLHLYADDDVVIIKDKYPKARKHYLVKNMHQVLYFADLSKMPFLSWLILSKQHS